MHLKNFKSYVITYNGGLDKVREGGMKVGIHFKDATKEGRRRKEEKEDLMCLRGGGRDGPGF